MATAATAASRLEAAGFERVDETRPFPKGPGRRFLVRHGAVVAWVQQDDLSADAGFRVVGTHTDSPAFKVKPGARLSLQSHQHRAEHWIVVRGVARVTRDNDVFELHANQSTYIPLGAKHRLENPGTQMLELIEVQSGDYLGEDDIVRYEDVYGRS